MGLAFFNFVSCFLFGNAARHVSYISTAKLLKIYRIGDEPGKNIFLTHHDFFAKIGYPKNIFPRTPAYPLNLNFCSSGDIRNATALDGCQKKTTNEMRRYRPLQALPDIPHFPQISKHYANKTFLGVLATEVQAPQRDGRFSTQFHLRFQKRSQKGSETRSRRGS